MREHSIVGDFFQCDPTWFPLLGERVRVRANLYLD
jgi:hypothetical protein